MSIALEIKVRDLEKSVLALNAELELLREQMRALCDSQQNLKESLGEPKRRERRINGS